jgi:hypothetical protein
MATVTTLAAQIGWQVDRVRGGRVAAADLLAFAIQHYREAWEIVINACRERFVKTGPAAGTFALTGGASSNSYPIVESDFYDLFHGERGAVQLRHEDGVNWLDVPEHRREKSRLSYRFEGDTIFLEPPDDAIGTFRFRYVYKPADLSAVGTTIVDFNGWIERYLLDVLTVRVRDREEEQPGIIADLLTAHTARVAAFASNRRAPGRVRDVRSRRRRPDDDAEF